MHPPRTAPRHSLCSTNSLLFTLLAPTALLLGCVIGAVIKTHTSIPQLPPENGSVNLQDADERDLTLESYLISFHESEAFRFKKRNLGSGLADATGWFPATNGKDAVKQADWLHLSGIGADVNATEFFEPSAHKGYKVTHAVGCYLSHWHLLRLVAGRHPDHRPDLLFVFEEDASCVDGLRSSALRVIKTLPKDWDIMYLGGKHFTHYKRNKDHKRFNETDRENFRELACGGEFRLGDGPLAPDGSRDLSLEQDYWQTKYVLNTEAYVVNLRRLNHVMRILSPKDHAEEPLDIALAEAISAGTLKAYMPTKAFCNQRTDLHFDEPFPWVGFFCVPGIRCKWDYLFFPECPGRY